MKRALLAACLLVLGMAAGAQAERGPGNAGRNSYANPSAVIASESAFARLSREAGQWTAFAQFAAPDAVMFAPQMVYAQQWLKGRPNPPAGLDWQPHEVWSSCDGSLMVSHGAWTKGAAQGWFTTIWQRQKDGSYKWVLDHGDELAQALAAPEMIAGHVADCPERVRPSGPPPKQDKTKTTKVLPPLDPSQRTGKADDGSLWWEIKVAPSGERTLSVSWKRDGADASVLTDHVAAGR